MQIDLNEYRLTEGQKAYDVICKDVKKLQELYDAIYKDIEQHDLYDEDFFSNVDEFRQFYEKDFDDSSISSLDQIIISKQIRVLKEFITEKICDYCKPKRKLGCLTYNSDPLFLRPNHRRYVDFANSMIDPIIENKSIIYFTSAAAAA